MTTPEFVIEHLETIYSPCRVCDRLLDCIETELLPLYEAGKLDERMVKEDITEASLDCGMRLEILKHMAKREIEPESALLDPAPIPCKFKKPPKRLLTEG